MNVRASVTILLLLSVTCLAVILSPAFFHPRAAAANQITSPGAGWQVQCIVCPPYIPDLNSRALQLDSSGVAHTVYGGDSLYHGWYENGTWQTEVAVAAAGAGYQAALAIEDDVLHALYYYTTPGSLSDPAQLHYARQTPTGWEGESIDDFPSASNLAEPAIAVHAASGLHVAYVYDGALRYGHREASGWVLTTVEASSVYGVALALDAGGQPALAYGGDSGLYYALLTADGWQQELVDPSGKTGLVSLALGATGNPHIAYQVDGQTPLYASQDAAGWQIEVIEQDDYFLIRGNAISLAVDGEGRPHVAYTYLQQSISPYPLVTWYGLYYAVRENGQWQYRGFGDGSKTALALDGENRPHIAYLSEMKVGHLVQLPSDGWESSTIMFGGDPGRQLSLQADGRQHLHAAYRDAANGVMFYARQTADGWQIEAIADRALGVTDEIAFALGQQGYPHFLYSAYARFRPTLNYLYWDAAGRHNFLLSDQMYVDGYNLATSENGQVHIVRSGLYYAVVDRDTPVYPEGLLLEFNRIAKGSYTAKPAIVADAAGKAHVVYHTPDESLAYAVKEEGGWYTETLPLPPAAGGDSLSLALDTRGNPHLAYAHGDTLAYAYRDRAGWHRETAATSPHGYRDISLALTASDRPYISYYDPADGDLAYATREATVWSVTTLLAEGDVGYYSSAVFAGHDLHIAFYDTTRHDLLLISRPFTPTDFFYLPVVNRP